VPGNPPRLYPFQNPENHHLRPVFTDPLVLSKLLERVVTHRLNSFIHQNHILLPEQLGFRKQQSTVCQLTRITDCITRGFNFRKQTGMVLLDIEKAYNTVWLNGPLFKLILLHLPDYLLLFSVSPTWKVAPLLSTWMTLLPPLNLLPPVFIRVPYHGLHYFPFTFPTCRAHRTPISPSTQKTLPFFLSPGGLILYPEDSVTL
jgi:hypothetical protein